MTKNTKNKPYWENFKKDSSVDTDIVGFDEKNIMELTKKYPSIKTTIKKTFGSVGRNKREILRQRKTISHHTKLLNKYLDRMESDRVKYMNMLEYLSPKVTLKRPTKSFKYWRGKVWWRVGKNKWGKKGWKEFHIISEKKRVKLGLSEDEVREMGKDKFRDKLILNDIDFNQT